MNSTFRIYLMLSGSVLHREDVAIEKARVSAFVLTLGLGTASDFERDILNAAQIFLIANIK